MVKERLDGTQLAWMYQDFKQHCSDEYVYEFEFLNAVKNWDTLAAEDFVTAVTKKKIDDYDLMTLGCDSGYDIGQKWERATMEFGAILDLMLYRSDKTKRARRDFWATKKWLDKLPLDTRVEL